MTRLPPEERLALQKMEFLDLVQRGVPQLHAAIDVGWSLTQWKHVLASSEFNELVLMAEEYVTDGIELRLLKKAEDGNMEAIKMWLVNRRPDRWADRREVRMTGDIQVAQVIVDGTRNGLLAMLEDQQLREATMVALAPGGAIDVEEAEVVDD